LTHSPGARAYYDRQRAIGKTHNQALRALANRLSASLPGAYVDVRPIVNASPGLKVSTWWLDIFGPWDV
jgi:hypothetical protein